MNTEQQELWTGTVAASTGIIDPYPSACDHGNVPAGSVVQSIVILAHPRPFANVVGSCFCSLPNPSIVHGQRMHRARWYSIVGRERTIKRAQQQPQQKNESDYQPGREVARRRNEHFLDNFCTRILRGGLAFTLPTLSEELSTLVCVSHLSQACEEGNKNGHSCGK